MENKILSNFFVPKSSKQFWLKQFEGLKFDKIDREELEYSSPHNTKLPVGLWDGCKVNNEYKNLLEILEIAKISKDDAILLLQNSISQSKNYQLSEEILSELALLQQNPAVKIDQSPTTSEIETIALWKTTGLGYDDLAQKLQKNAWYVRNCVMKY